MSLSSLNLPPLSHPNGSPVRVLVVDDEPALADLVAMGCRMLGWDTRLAHRGREAVEIARRNLDKVGLSGKENVYPAHLSGGQQQRVAIARALSMDPDMMLFDEPTSALDVSVQARVLELFQELQEEMGFACLFVTHDLAVVDALANRICVMKDGHIVEQGDRDAILRSPQQAYTKRLLAAVPVPDPDQQAARRELRSRLIAEGAE